MKGFDVNDERLALLSAYLDGELAEDEKATVESWLREDPAAQRLLAELRETVGLISSLPRRSAPPSVADDLRRRLERDELLGEAPTPAPRRGGRWSLVRSTLSMAAVLGVVVVAGLYIANDLEEKPTVPAAPPGSMAARSAEPPPVSPETDSTSEKRRLAQERRARVADAGLDRRRQPATPEAEGQPGSSSLGEARERVASASRRRRDEPTPSLSADQSAVLDREEPEALVLAVVVGSEQARQDIRRKLLERFSGTDLAVMSQSDSAGDPSHGDEYALRVPARLLPEVIDRVDPGASAGRLSLRAGPLSVEGERRVRSLIDVIAAAPTDDQEKAARAVPEQRSPALETAMRELLAVFGLDPDGISSLLRAASTGQREALVLAPPPEEPLYGPPEPRRDAAEAQPPSKEPSTLVARRMREIERADEPPGDTEPSDAETGEAPAHVANRSLTLPSAAEETTRTAPRSDMVAEEPLITLIIRVATDPSLGSIEGGTSPSPSNDEAETPPSSAEPTPESSSSEERKSPRQRKPPSKSKPNISSFKM